MRSKPKSFRTPRPLRDVLADLSTMSDDEFVLHAYAGTSDAEKTELQQQGYAVYGGKVREVVRAPRPGAAYGEGGGSRLWMIHTDRLTAFDRLVAMVPYKGEILAAITRHWLERLAARVPQHLLGSPHPRLLTCHATDPVRIEVVVRGYLAGSMMRSYKAGARIYCGAKVDDGLEDFGPLESPILTPTTKAAAFEHDENATPDELIARGVCTAQEWQKITDLALKIFAEGQAGYAERGWILVDTKYEFGRAADGSLMLIDEVHTPDSSRLWEKASYADRLARGVPPVMFDKENVRRWLLERGYHGFGEAPQVPRRVLVDLAKTYLDIAESLTGTPLMTQGPIDEDLAMDLFR